ncbi:MAG: hypothetical protein ACYCSB_01160 [bacterium]
MILGSVMLVALIYLTKLNFLYNLSDFNSVNIFINSLVALGTILLASATFFSLFMTKIKDDIKQKTLLSQLNMEHLSDIKENCLRPMLGLINDNYYNYSMFEISEQNKFTDISIQTEIDRPTHSWDKEVIYGINYNIVVNNRLYKDLENHKITEHIPAEFHSVLELIIKNYPIYLKNISDLFRKIKEFNEFKELASQIEQKHKNQDKSSLDDLKDEYIRLIILLSLNYPNIKYYFQNYFYMAYNDGEYENVRKISDIFKNGHEVKEILSIKNKVRAKVEVLRERTENILNLDILLDECDYLKQKREILL